MKRKFCWKIPSAILITVFVICLLIALGIWRKPIFDLLTKKAPRNQTVATQEEVIIKTPPIISTGDLDIYKETPKITEYTLGTSTFAVVHWNPTEDISKPSAIAVYDKNDHELKQVYSDLGHSCGQPYDYGIINGYFYIHKNINPCEAVSEDWYWWYDKNGKLVVSYTSNFSSDNQYFYYELSKGSSGTISLLYDKKCNSFAPPDSWSPDLVLPKVKLLGIEIGKQKIEFKPPKEVSCEYIELNDIGMVNPGYSIESQGTLITIILPTKEELSFDVCKPSLYRLNSEIVPPKGWKVGEFQGLNFIYPTGWMKLIDKRTEGATSDISLAAPSSEITPENGIAVEITPEMDSGTLAAWPVTKGAVIELHAVAITPTSLSNFNLGGKTEIKNLTKVKYRTECTKDSCVAAYSYLKGEKIYRISIRYQKPLSFPEGITGLDFIDTIIQSLH